MDKPDPWVHRINMMQCRTCMWYVTKQKTSGMSLLGRCRKNAPSLDGFPVVFITDWCGKHKLDENYSNDG